MRTENISYTVNERIYRGYLALPDRSRPGPAVLICHPGVGLVAHTREVTEKLAELGYVAFALDYYGDGQPIAIEEVDPRINELKDDVDALLAIARGGLAELLVRDEVDPARVAVIGYCFGGSLAFELARSGVDLRAVVGFHAGLWKLAPERPSQIKGSVLALAGGSDPHASHEEQLAFEAEMNAIGADWSLTIYGGAEHAFTNPESSTRGIGGLAYHQTADERSWRAMLALFDEVL